jgi:hypothetical protein
MSLIVSRECLDELQQFIYQRCPCSLEDREFLPELVCIVEEEVVRAIQAEHARLLEQLRRPGTS